MAKAQSKRAKRTASRRVDATRKAQRPRINREKVERTLEALEQGTPLRQALRDEGISWARWVRWVREDEALRERYYLVRDAYLDWLAEEVIEIADSATAAQTTAEVHAARLRFDARRWYLSKLAPKRYGDKVAVEHSGSDGGPIQHRHEHRLDQEQVDAVARALKARVKSA